MSNTGMIGLLSLGMFLGFILHYNFAAESTSRITKPYSSTALSSPATVRADIQNLRPGSTESSGLTRPGLSEIAEIPTGFRQTTAIYALASQAGMSELLDLLDQVTQYPLHKRRNFQGIFYTRFAEMDPPAAVAHLLDNSASFPRANLAAIFLSWSRRDLAAALEYASTLNRYYATAIAQTLLMARFDLSDIQRIDIANKLKVSYLLPSLDAMQTSESNIDPALAWQQVAKNAPGATVKLNALIQHWTAQDPMAALGAVQSLENLQQKQQLLSMLFAIWGSADPGSAISWAATQSDEKLVGNLLRHAFQNLSTSDPLDALAIADGFSENSRNIAHSSIFQTWSKNDPRAAADWLATAPENLLSDNVIATIAYQFASAYPNEAIKWAESLSEVSADVVFSQMANAIAQRDPENASALLGSISSSRNKKRAESTIARHWAQQDPKAALGWVKSYEHSKNKAHLYAQIMDTWARQGYEEPVAYIGTMKQSFDKDRATVSVLRHITNNAALTRQLYESIQDPDQKKHAEKYRLGSI